eukprot:gb/GFBE01018213.1/.p1 GENE.gb/GFBE01018213.1/~~gb/GFBE01018213.1/.p1  ORF type:complete len:208 (+),score=39.54 gb/GFBE01018213.1/:1-624(+)
MSQRVFAVPAMWQAGGGLRLRARATFIDAVDEDHVFDTPDLRRSRSSPPGLSECYRPWLAINIDKATGSRVEEHEAHDERQAPHFVRETEQPTDDECGVPPEDPRWMGVYKIMIKNLPARCYHEELRKFIVRQVGCQAWDEAWELHMPLGTNNRNRGFAFVLVRSTTDVHELAKALWQQKIPSRQSEKVIHIYPAQWRVTGDEMHRV